MQLKPGQKETTYFGYVTKIKQIVNSCWSGQKLCHNWIIERDSCIRQSITHGLNLVLKVGNFLVYHGTKDLFQIGILGGDKKFR